MQGTYEKPCIESWSMEKILSALGPARALLYGGGGRRRWGGHHGDDD